MSAAGIRIDADTLQQHASAVEQLAAGAAEAVSAIGSITLSGGAFGLMCAWMIPPVAAVSAVVSSTISSGEDLISRTADEIRLAAGDFETQEQEALDTVHGLESAFGA
jgi:hypothetical protein